jgi:hypothetical protein
MIDETAIIGQQKFAHQALTPLAMSLASIVLTLTKHPETLMADAKGALRNQPIILSLSKEIGWFLSSRIAPTRKYRKVTGKSS